MIADLEMKSPMDGQLLERDRHYGPFVYFKVKKIVPEILGFYSLLADTDHTSVFQVREIIKIGELDNALSTAHRHFKDCSIK